MLHFIYCYAQCHYAECRYAECHNAECRYAECRYAECCSALSLYCKHFTAVIYVALWCARHYQPLTQYSQG